MIRFSLFPKFLQHLSADELAATVADVGLDTTNVVVRDGFWVSPAGLREELPRFLAAMRARGLTVDFATTGYGAAELAADDTPLAVLADHGIRALRIGYFPGKVADVRGAIDGARRDLAALAERCRHRGIRAVYQVHHGMLIPSASMAWHVMGDLPSEAIGVELDPGNQAHEGMEDWTRSARLLGAHLAAWGVKDVAWERTGERDAPDKGWRRTWAACDEGVVDWHAVVAACRAVDFAGPFVLMPFYHHAEPERLIAVLRREVAYLRRVVQAVAPPADAGSPAR